jgi:dienelactone hydrolase
MILGVAFPAQADSVTGAEKVAFAGIFGWWLPAQGAGSRPAVIGLHGCGALNARERAMVDLLRSRGFHVLLPDSCTADRRTDIHRALDWLAARPEVDRTRIVVIGWSDGGSAVLAALNHRIGAQPLQARAAIAFDPGCSPYARTQGSYLPVAPLLILIGALDDGMPPAPCAELGKWTPKVMVQVFPERHRDSREQAHAAVLEFLMRELR